jgi:hypothetical protein
VLLVSLTADLTFFLDEWSLITRPGWGLDTLLEPHNEHPYLAPIVIYKVLLEVFGMGSVLPFQLVNIGLAICVAGLTMVLVRPRLGPVPALIAAAVLLTLGAAWETLLWPMAMGFLGSLACGLGALIALDRERPRDGLICALLVAGICSSSVGLVFIVGVAVDAALRPGRAPTRERLRRAWVVAVPVALAAAWYLAYGSEAESAASLANLAGIPVYAMNAAATVCASLLGLISVDPESSGALAGTAWGRILVIAGLVGAVLVILLAAELLRGRRLRPAGAAAAIALAVVVVASNVVALRDGQRFLLGASDIARAELAALETAGEHANRDLVLSPDVADSPHLATVVAGPYLDAVAAFGSPVDLPDDLAGSSEANRARADGVLAAALGLALAPGAEPERGTCRRLAPGEAAELAPGEVTIRSRDGVGVRVARFGASPSVELGRTAATATLDIPADASPQPWRLIVDGAAEVCS